MTVRFREGRRISQRSNQWFAFSLMACCTVVAYSSMVHAQTPAAAPAEKSLEVTPPGREAPPELPTKQVEVAPTVTDTQIGRRLQKILEATPDWFYEPNVEVQDGVAFIRGQTKTEDRKVWAGELARSTEGVVAVVNLLDVMQSSVWDFQPALTGMYDLWKISVRRSPWVVFGIVVIGLAYVGSRLMQTFLLWAFQRRVASPLLRGIAAWVGGAAVFLVGLYIVLYVSGLTRLALTLLGGTGLIGLVLGIGFRDITENFLSSIFLSTQTPFRNGDVVHLNDVSGIVQRMTIRSTLLMTFDGNHVQIPNSVVYKSTITNYTSNPNRRQDFTVGIAYDAEIEKAQTVAQGLLHEHPAVLQDPEPMVLAESLGPMSVMLRIYFWVDMRETDPMKVKSAVIRLIKRRFEEEGIVIRDGTREFVFSRDVPVRLLERNGKAHAPGPVATAPAESIPKRAPPQEEIATAAEGGLVSEEQNLKQQAERARTPEGGADLLKPAVEKEEKIEQAAKLEQERHEQDGTAEHDPAAKDPAVAEKA